VAATERSYSARPPIRVIENWVDVERIRAGATGDAGASVRRELAISPDAKVLGLIGNCGYPKNHELVSEALQAVEAPVEVLHAGNRRDEPEAEAKAWDSLSPRHTVHHLGVREDVPALLAASDLVLLPSLYEGFPLAAAEALCAGVPLLASETVGLRWLTSVASATLVPLRTSAWSGAISGCLTEGPSRDALAASTVEARARLAPERGVTEYVQAYRAALETRPSLRTARTRRSSPGHLSA
jgi:glycosyltransferase involved in cell wall biosynthesis